MAAVPPSKKSHSIRCETGVLELPNGDFVASVTWQGEPGVRYEESLGLKPKPWFAGVAHDVALCARAYHTGDRQLHGLQHAGSSGRGDGERLNFPLSCYVNQPPFWKALEHMSFGELALKLCSSRELDKTLFFGNEWQAGLGEQRMAADPQRQQQAEPQRQQQQQQHTAAAPTRHGQQASGSLPRSSSSDEPHRRAPKVGAGAAPADADAGSGGRAGKLAVPSPPPKHHDKAAVVVQQQPQKQDVQQQQRRLPAELGQSPPASPRAARKAVTVLAPAAESPAAAAAAAAESPPPAAAAAESPAAAAAAAAAAAEVAQANGGPATSSDEDVPLIARKQHPKQHHAAAAPSPPASPAKRSQPAAAKPAGVAAAPRSPRPAKAPQPAAHGQGQRGQEVQQQQPQQQQPPLQQPQQPQQQQQQPVPPRPGKEAEPKTVWAKPAEFPAGSGKYAFYLKEGPLSRGYFTVANEADIALLGSHTGAVTLRDAATGKSWPVKTHLKQMGGSKSRYLTATTAFNRENELRPHDVLWLSAGEPHGQQLLFGVWRWGSPEAAAFKAHLGSGKPGSGKKRTRAQLLQEAADAAAAVGNGGAAGPSEDESDAPLIKRRQPQQPPPPPPQQQQQQPVVSSSSDEDMPLSARRQRQQQQRQQPVVSSSSDEDRPLSARRQQPQGASALSPATAKAFIKELFDDDDS